MCSAWGHAHSLPGPSMQLLRALLLALLAQAAPHAAAAAKAASHATAAGQAGGSITATAAAAPGPLDSETLHGAVPEQWFVTAPGSHADQKRACMAFLERHMPHVSVPRRLAHSQRQYAGG
jgi:sarcosine oxidase gamma subunit